MTAPSVNVLRWVGFASLVAIGAAVAGGDPPFHRIDAFGTGHTIPIAWGDYDNDGDLDLAVGNYGDGNELYTNNGGLFTRSVPFGVASTFAVVWADSDNDGDLDLAVGSIGQCWHYINQGDGTFQRITRFGSNRTIAMAWADTDLDGDLDLATGNGILGVSQPNYLYVNDGGTFSELARFGMGQSCTAAWGDYDNDGDADLAVGRGGFGYVGQNYLYINQGDNTFIEQAQFGMGDTASVAWADANNDGWLDLAVGNWNAGQSYLYLNNGDGTFAERPAFGARDTNTVAWGDADLDGDLDIAFGNGDFQSAGQNYLYLNDGTGTFREVAQFGLGSTDSVAWADYDGDGDLDLAVGNEHSPTQNELWINDSPASPYLALRLTGQAHRFGGGYSNRSAAGAKVAVYAAGHLGDPAFRRGTQVVNAHGGFSSQNAMELTFGLPQDTQVDLRIDWPGSGGSHLTRALGRVPVNQRLAILEWRLGDANCDGLLNFADINPFVLALSNPDEYRRLYPGCDIRNADCNHDGTADFGDINPFVQLLSGG